jgi:hypothetical protein
VFNASAIACNSLFWYSVSLMGLLFIVKSF